MKKLLYFLSFIISCSSLCSAPVLYSPQELRKLLVRQDDTIAKAFFPRPTNVRDLLINLINHEQLAIKMAIFYLSDPHIMQALIKARQRHVLVDVIADQHSITKSTLIHLEQCASNNITLHIFKAPTTKGPAPLMHNKFCIFECNFDHRPLLWTGSFNFTILAQRRNQENVIILSDPLIMEQYRQQFLLLKNYGIPFHTFLKEEVSIRVLALKIAKIILKKR